MIRGGGLVASQSIVPNAATTTTPISQRTDVLPILDALQKIPFEVLCPPRVQNARILISLAKYHSVRGTRGGAQWFAALDIVPNPAPKVVRRSLNLFVSNNISTISLSFLHFVPCN